MRRLSEKFHEWLRSMLRKTLPLAEQAGDVLRTAKTRLKWFASAPLFPMQPVRLYREVCHTERIELSAVRVETSTRHVEIYEERAEFLALGVRFTTVQEESRTKRVEFPDRGIEFSETHAVRRVRHGCREAHSRLSILEEASQ